HVNGRVIVVSASTGRILPPLAVGSDPRQLVIDKSGGQALVLSDYAPYVKDREQQQGELRVIRGSSIVATIPVAPDPQFVRISPDRDYFHVFSPRALTSLDAVAMRDAGRLRIDRAGISWWRVAYGGGPGTVSDATISPDGARAYVLHAGSS